jgi:Ca2+-binding EF-hand superfamily protein
MVLKSLFTRKGSQKGMKLPPHLQEIKNNTKFSAKEIMDFQKKFRKICSSGETELNMKEFVKFMRMMGVKSNATLVSRIFTLMDVDGSGSISFGEFMKYFNVLLQGSIEQKAEFCFFIIAVGNELNLSLSKQEKFFTRNDLFQLLKIISESQKKHM